MKGVDLLCRECTECGVCPVFSQTISQQLSQLQVNGMSTRSNVQLVQRTRGNETVGAVVSERSRTVLYACVGPDAGGVLLAIVSWCRDQGYNIVSAPVVNHGEAGQRPALRLLQKTSTAA